MQRGHPVGRIALAAALFVAAPLFVCPSPALAGNDDAVLLGNEAAMTAGAVTAVVSDGSAVWYNFAGLGHVLRDTVDVSGNAFMLRIGTAPGLLVSSSGERDDGDYVRLVSIPSAMTYVRPLGNGVNLGIGIFVPGYDSSDYQAEVSERGASFTSRWFLANSMERKDTALGIGIGASPVPQVRLGVGLFLSYGEWDATVDFAGAVELDDGSLSFVQNRFVRASLLAIGAQIGAGLQWEPVPGLHLGLSVRTPSAVFLTSYSVDAVIVTGGGASGYDSLLADASLQPDFELFAPTRVTLGFAYRWSGGWIGAEADIQHELSSPNVGVDRRLVWNARVGGRVQVDRTLSVGAGLFTDNRSRERPTAFGDLAVDYYGLSAGFEIRNPHRLGADEPVESFEFVSTIALRYAFGYGTMGGLRFDAAAAGGAVSVAPIDTFVQEIGLHIGSALYF